MTETRTTTESEPAPERGLGRSPVDGRRPEPMSPERRAVVAEACEQIRRVQTASDEEVEAAFRSFGLRGSSIRVAR